MTTSNPGAASAEGRTVVVGIDFGTTYSGIAWAETERPDRIIPITTWPSDRSNHGGFSSAKVPTKLRYLNNGEFEWGAQIPDDADPSDVNSLFKLGLEPERLRSASDATGEILDIDEVDQMITDYLLGLVDHFMSIIRSQVGEQLLQSTRLHFVLTVPAIWSDLAKQRTLQAFGRVQGLPNGVVTTLLSEPEAAAISALRELDRHSLNIGDSFVVVDAGGGTVDLITYTITALNPVLEVREAAEGTGAFCGSSRINERFVRFLTARLGREDGWDEDVLHDALERFDTSTKRRFTLNSLTQSERFTIPVPGLGLNRGVGVDRNGRFSLRAEDVHMFFEPEILKIIQLVKAQIAVSNASIRSILLVGGYGASMYLKERLQMAVSEDQTTGQNIEVLQPPNAWLAVVQGAVMKGISQARPENYDVPVVKARTARKHYGVVLGYQFDDVKHATIAGQKYWDGYVGVWRVQAMDWFIRRGELVSEDTPFTEDYSIQRPVAHGRLTSTSLVVYADESSPVAPVAQDNNVKVLCRLTADLSHIPESQLDQRMGQDGRMYYQANFEVEAVYHSASTEYTLSHKGQRYPTVTAEYV